MPDWIDKGIPQHLGPVDVTALIPYVAIICVIGFILAIVPGLIWIERVVIALMQDRLGPNRVGPRGLLQTIADGIKLFFKEDVEPAAVDKKIYYVAPVISMIPALAAGATIPFGTLKVHMDSGESRVLPLVTGNINIGLVYILALSSLQVYGIVLGGWSSNNKYSLLGGLRSSAQMISYELAMSLALLTGVLMSGSLNLVDIVNSQKGGFWHWNMLSLKYYFIPGFLAAWIYLIAMVAETNRAPFDLPEAESELIAGFHTEYSSMKFAMFFMGEYASMLAVSGLATTLWLGGWHPILDIAPLTWIPGFVWFLGKLMTIILVYVWLRASLPRLRYDALMNLGWKRMLPIALVLMFIVAAIDTFRPGATQVQATIDYYETPTAASGITANTNDPAKSTMNPLTAGVTVNGQ
jgi:NADH-quinone oxidoreductase subunit H